MRAVTPPEVEPVNIGRPKRIIEVEPATLPLPEPAFPIEEPAPGVPEPVPGPVHEPTPTPVHEPTPTPAETLP